MENIENIWHPTKYIDSIYRPTLWKILKIYGIPQKYIDAFQELHTNSLCCVKAGSGTTGYFKEETGVQQGDIPSPFFFLVVMDYIITKEMSPSHFGIIWQKTKLKELDFADDLALLTYECEQMQLMIDSLKNSSKKVGPRSCVDKTKIQKIENLENDADIFLKGAPLEVVENFTYLGSIQSNDGDFEEDVKSRIRKAFSVFRRLQTVWGSKVISLTAELCFCFSIVL